MKTKILLLFGALLCAFSSAPAQQWFRYKDFPLNVIPSDIAINNAGTLFMAVQDGRMFYKPKNGSWTFIPGYFQDGGNFPPPAITVEKQSNRLYVGTDFSGLYMTSDFGATWSNLSLTTNPVSGHNEDYSCFTEVNDPNLFFAGTSGGIVKVINRGASGSITAFGNSFNSSPVAVHYTRNHTLLTGGNDGIWRSIDNGAIVRQTNFRDTLVYRFAEDLNGRVYALGKDISTSKCCLLWSDNDYRNWNTAALPNNNEDYTALYYDSTTSRLWLGSQSGLYQTAVGTLSWQSANLNNGAHSVVEVIGDRNGVYNFNRQQVAQQRNSSATAWENINQGLTGDINQILFSRNNQLYAYQYLFSEELSSLAPPSGTPPSLGNWQNRFLGGAPNYRIMFACKDPQDPNVVYSYTNEDKLFRSDNNGATFTQTNLPAEFAPFSARVQKLISGEQSGLFAIGSDFNNPSIGSKLFGSFDKGNTWSVVSDFSPRGPEEVSQDATGRLFATVINDTTLVRNLYYSADTGRSWTLLQEDIFPFGQIILYTSGNRTFIRNAAELFEVHTSGPALTPINLPPPTAGNPPEVQHFRISRDGTMYIYNHSLFRSTNNGSTWQDLGRPAGIGTDDNMPSLALEIAFDSIPFIVPRLVRPDARGIYYYRNTPMLSIREVSRQNNLALYPNPADRAIEIKTSYRGNMSLVNVLGQVLQQGKIKQELTRLDISGLASGVYFLRLDDTGQSVRLVKQ